MSAPKHAYGELLPSIDEYLQQILEENSREAVVNGLADYLQSEWNKKNLQSSRKGAIKKAEAILEGQEMPRKPPKIKNTRISRKEILEEALAKGFLNKTRLSIPWHPKPFLEGKIETLPFQHESVVVYTAVGIQDFLNEDYTRDSASIQKSALDLRYIPAQSEWNDGDTVNLESPNAFDQLIYAGFLSAAQFFGEKISDKGDPSGAAVLEVEVPIDNFHIMLATVSSWTSCSNTKELAEKFEYQLEDGKSENIVQAFRQSSIENIENGGRGGRGEDIHFALPHQIDLWNIRGVWDMEYFEDPLFEPLGEYIKHLKGRHPEGIPEGIEAKKARKKIMEELEKFKDISEKLEEIESKVSSLESNLEKIEEARNKGKKEALELTLGRLELNLKGKVRVPGDEIDSADRTKGYETLLYELKRMVEDYYGVEIQFGNKIDTIKGLEENISEVERILEGLEKELKEDFEEEKKRQQKENQWSEEKFKKEVEFEKHLEKNIIQNIEKLPRLKKVLEDVERKRNKLNQGRKRQGAST